MSPSLAFGQRKEGILACELEADQEPLSLNGVAFVLTILLAQTVKIHQVSLLSRAVLKSVCDLVHCP